MIRVLIEGDDNRAKHLYVQYLRGSAQGMRTATDQEIIVVTDDDLVPEDLAGIELLIETGTGGIVFGAIPAPHKPGSRSDGNEN